MKDCFNVHTPLIAQTKCDILPNGKIFSDKKRNKVLIHITPGMNLKNIVLGERSQTRKTR